jgi:hypothetical protein
MCDVLNVDELVNIVNGGKEPLDAKNHWLVPQHGGGLGSFRWCISAKSGGGKTNLVVSTLMQGQIRFDHLYLYVRDPAQPKYVLLLKWINTLEKMFSDANNGAEVSMVTVITDPAEIVPVDELDSSIINVAVFDDMLLEKHQEKILEYFVRGRHRSVDCIYLGQAYHMIDGTLRKQCDYFTIFSVSSKAELIQLSKDHSLMHDYNEFKDILTKATSSRNDFLFIDRRSEFPIMQLRRNFDYVWNTDTKEFEPIMSGIKN